MIFLDYDGVLADFDTAYERLTGTRPTRWPQPDNVNWNRVQPGFYATLPLMPYACTLFEACRKRGPLTILTGVPRSKPEVAFEKQSHIAMNFGDVPVICCASKDKWKHGKPNDILIDDWLKYRPEWEGMGGRFIHHTSLADTLDQLTMLEIRIDEALWRR